MSDDRPTDDRFARTNPFLDELAERGYVVLHHTEIEELRAEIERLRVADGAREADAKLMRDELWRLGLVGDPLRDAFAYLRRVIVSGEPMTPETEQVIDNAFSRLDENFTSGRHR